MANNAKTALLCAYTLARAKQYAEAEALILSNEELSKTPEAIDLLARVRMEEGDEAEARRLWQSIQAIYPEHKPTRAALHAIGRPTIRFKWKSFLIALLPIAFLAGFLLSFVIMRTPQPEVTIIEWENIPTQTKINELAPYKQSTKRVCIASCFFSNPDKLFSRALLTELISDALELPTSAIFIGEAPEALGENTIRVELLKQ